MEPLQRVNGKIPQLLSRSKHSYLQKSRIRLVDRFTIFAGIYSGKTTVKALLAIDNGHIVEQQNHAAGFIESNKSLIDRSS